MYKKIDHDFALRIKEIRLKRGLSQIELALKAKISRATMFRIEDGQKPGPKICFRLAQALDVSMLELEGYKPTHTPEGQPVVVNSSVAAMAKIVTEQAAEIERLKEELGALTNAPPEVIEAIKEHDGSFWTSILHLLSMGKKINASKKSTP
jgi:transcriptional regulator with XRE-family HTH domain